MPRQFTAASTEHIDFAAGSLASFGVNMASFGVLCRPTSFAAIGCPMSGGAALATGWHVTWTTAGKINVFANNVGSLAPTVYTVDKWYLVICTKANGSAAPRVHVYDYAADTWVHEAAATAIGNSSTPVTRGALGVNGAQAQPFDGHIAAAATWSALLSDAQCEDLPHNLMNWWSPPGSAAIFWVLDQDSTSQKVQDLRGLGAASSQSGITGTSISALSQPISYGHPVIIA